MNEVVVTALGIKRETKSLTYNVQQIGGDEVAKAKDMKCDEQVLPVRWLGVNHRMQVHPVLEVVPRVVMRGTKVYIRVINQRSCM
mgnify:CR=1 FL=1